jgi:hypothetical protein
MCAAGYIQRQLAYSVAVLAIDASCVTGLAESCDAVAVVYG